MNSIKKNYIPVTGSPDVSHLKVEKYYMKNRGLCVSVTPVKLRKSEGCTMEEYDPLAAAYSVVQKMDRFNAKKCAEFDTTETENQLIEIVKKEQCLQLQ